MIHKDYLTNCDRCSKPLCYVPTKASSGDDIENFYCFGCGFNTNSIAKVGSEFIEQQMALYPDLYKDLMGEGEDGKVWMPAFVNTEKGMLFADGTDGDNWAWAAVKMIPTTEEDDEIIRREKYKPDNDSKKYFA